MARGDVSVGVWQEATARLVKRLHVAAYAAAVGGIDVTREPVHAARLFDVVRFHLSKPERFARQVELRTKSASTERQVVARARMYPAAANATFEKSRRAAFEDAAESRGAEALERNVLGFAEHCPECLRETARGVGSLGSTEFARDADLHGEFQVPAGVRVRRSRVRR